MNRRRIVGLIVLSVLIIVILAVSSYLVETNKAGFLQVKQAAITGTLTCKLEPGMYGQMFGDIHTYLEADTYFFTADKETGQKTNQSLPTRFKDGAKAQVSGSLRVLLPRNCKQLVKIHRKFQNMDNLMSMLVLPALRKTLFSSGPHMTAGESYAERRGEFASLAENQLIYGVIKVDKYETERIDQITGEKRSVWVLTKRACKEENNLTCIDGFSRDISAFTEFGISITNFVIDGIEYSVAVLEQIETQRKARMSVVTQQAQAKEAEARAVKAKAEAKAKVAETRAVEEVKKTEITVRAEAQKEKIILEAEATKQQAKLEMEAAEYTKQKEIKLGEGEATRKRLVLEADGALAQKIAGWVEMNKDWADAFKERKVPSMVFGGGQGGGTDAAKPDLETVTFMKLINAITMKQLAIDMEVRTGGNTTR